MEPVVSIILTSYNKPCYVAKAIKSVYKQTFSNWELFIMDDNSNQETTSIIETFLKDRRIIYRNSQISHEKRHETTRYATLINEAIMLSKGKFITYLTDDTVYLPNRLQRMVKELISDSKKDIVYGSQLVKFVDQSGSVQSSFKTKTKGILQKAANIVDHCSVMHTRKVAEQVYQKYHSYWDDDPRFWHNGDAAFWARMNEFAPFFPIERTFEISYKTPYSFQYLNSYLPSSLPNGLLIKGHSSEFFLLENGKRRAFSAELFQQLNYDKKQVIVVPDPTLYKLKEGPKVTSEVFYHAEQFPDGRLVKSRNALNVYYIENGKKRLLTSEKALLKYKLDKSRIVEVSNSLLAQFPNGSNISETITRQTELPNGIVFKCKSERNEQFYFSINNVLHPIQFNVLTKLKLDKKIVKLRKKERSYFPIGKKIGWTFLKNVEMY